MIYEAHDKNARSGVRGLEGRGFGGSRFDSRASPRRDHRPYGVIGGLVTSKRHQEHTSSEGGYYGASARTWLPSSKHPGSSLARL